MELKRIDINDVTCDVGVCKNKACITVTGDDVSVENELRLCPECAEKLRKALNAYFKDNKR